MIGYARWTGARRMVGIPNIRRDEHGNAQTEYILIAVLIALVLIAAILPR